MDPAASESTVHSGNKRKNISLSGHEKGKRRKAVQECEETLEPGGEPGSPRVCVRLLQQPITLNELMELLHYAALGKPGGIKKPSWCRLRHQKRIKAVNVVIVEGVSQSHFYQHYLSLTHLRSRYTTRVTFTPPPPDVASAIFSSQLPESESLLRLQRHGENSQLDKALRIHPVITAFGSRRRGLAAYVLPQEEMIKRRFPVKGVVGFEEFVCTGGADCVTDSSPLFGLDCEMCLTEKGYELARVSLVDSDGRCLLDELVKPQNRILNYLTCFSGVTAAMLRPVRTTLRDVQAELRSLLPSDAVLVGHSINNDLMALKLIHQHVIDTSLLYRGERGHKFKLKLLAEVVLNRKIQTEDRRGHDPTEDAVAALELAQYFIRMGPRRVVELHLEDLWGYKIEDEPPDCAPSAPPSLRFADVLQTLGRSVAFVGRRADVCLSLSNQVWHSSDKQVLASFRAQAKAPFLSVLQLWSVSERLKKRPRPQELQLQQPCPALRDMCVVLAGPFPAAASQRDVKRLFRSCGAVRGVRMLKATVRVHAEVEFQLLEGAELALRTLDGLDVQGRTIKVQRPVHEALLDLDLALDALERDHLNSRRLYAVRLTPAAARVNGAQLQHAAGSKLSEETLRETFSHFGPVERVLLPVKPGRHAFVQFERPEDRRRALGSPEELRRHGYLVSPALTPAHLTSWVAMTTAAGSRESAVEGEERGRARGQDQDGDAAMLKLDRRLRRLFRSLPDGTLSVVVLAGDPSAPGLCLLEVKQDPAETGSG